MTPVSEPGTLVPQAFGHHFQRAGGSGDVLVNMTRIT